jgi:hypothetical protein
MLKIRKGDGKSYRQNANIQKQSDDDDLFRINF